MSKRLILILALAFAVGLTCAAYAEVQNVKVSGDLDMFYANRNLTLKGYKGGDGIDDTNVASFFATIARVRIDADLTDNVSATVRLLNERYWGRDDQLGPDTETGGHHGATAAASASDVHNTDINIDLAYVSLKEFLYSPLTLTVGRQELHFGNDMIVGDVDTNNIATTASAFGGNTRDPDLSARKSFDAVRATLNYDPLVVDVIVAVADNNDSIRISNDDTNLFGINANYALNKKVTLEGYWFEKNTGKKFFSNPASGDSGPEAKKTDRVDTIGARVVAKPIENLTYQLEGAFQFGEKAFNIITDSQPVVNTAPSAKRQAWALETALSYDFKKVKYTPSATLLYSYFSGGEYGTLGSNYIDKGIWRGWDPMFENQSPGHIANALLDQTNVSIVGGILSAKPVDDITLKGEYYAYWFAKAHPDGTTLTPDRRGDNITVTQRRFAGTELDLTATYDYTEDVQFALMGGWFMPGAAFVKGNDSTATEVIGSMKVTF